MGRVDYIYPHMGGVSDRKRGWGGVSWISVVVVDQIRHRRRRIYKKNIEKDPQLRVMDKFGEFFNPSCQEGHLCTMVPDGRYV